MSNVFTDLVTLIRRPTMPPPPPHAGKGRTEPAPALPATEAELVAALANLETARRAAEDDGIAAANLRERLLLEPTADEEIYAAARALEAAELLIERLDKLEPGLRQRLQGVRDAARAARWLELRDAYVAAAEKHLAFLREYEAIQWPLREAAIRALMAEFPASVTQLHNHPAPFVTDFVLPVTGAVAKFAASLEQVRGMVFDPAGKVPPPFVMVRDIIAEAKRTGIIPENASPDIRRALGLEVRIRFITATRDGQGVARAAGDVATFSPELASEEIESGRAFVMES